MPNSSDLVKENSFIEKFIDDISNHNFNKSELLERTRKFFKSMEDESLGQDKVSEIFTEVGINLKKKFLLIKLMRLMIINTMILLIFYFT